MQKELDAEIKEIIQRTSNVKSFRLDNRGGIDFKAGQFIRQFGSSVKVERFPLFVAPVKSTQYTEHTPQQKHKGILQRIFG